MGWFLIQQLPQQSKGKKRQTTSRKRQTTSKKRQRTCRKRLTTSETRQTTSRKRQTTSSKRQAGNDKPQAENNARIDTSRNLEKRPRAPWHQKGNKRAQDRITGVVNPCPAPELEKRPRPPRHQKRTVRTTNATATYRDHINSTTRSSNY